MGRSVNGVGEGGNLDERWGNGTKCQGRLLREWQQWEQERPPGGEVGVDKRPSLPNACHDRYRSG